MFWNSSEPRLEPLSTKDGNHGRVPSWVPKKHPFQVNDRLGNQNYTGNIQTLWKLCSAVQRNRHTITGWTETTFLCAPILYYYIIFYIILSKNYQRKRLLIALFNSSSSKCMHFSVWNQTTHPTSVTICQILASPFWCGAVRVTNEVWADAQQHLEQQ